MNKLIPKEVLVIQMALNTMIEDMEAATKNPELPFNPEARKDFKEMLTHAKSALKKISLASGHEVKLDPYVEGDEKEFFTKES